TYNFQRITVPAVHDRRTGRAHAIENHPPTATVTPITKPKAEHHPQMTPTSTSPQTPSPSFREALIVWLRVAALSFGGPAGQIAVMHRIVVEEKKWIDEQRFLHALNFCMLLPGPEAQQLATYLGWLLHGVR